MKPVFSITLAILELCLYGQVALAEEMEMVQVKNFQVPAGFACQPSSDSIDAHKIGGLPPDSGKAIKLPSPLWKAQPKNYFHPFVEPATRPLSVVIAIEANNEAVSKPAALPNMSDAKPDSGPSPLNQEVVKDFGFPLMAANEPPATGRCVNFVGDFGGNFLS